MRGWFGKKKYSVQEIESELNKFRISMEKQLNITGIEPHINEIIQLIETNRKDEAKNKLNQMRNELHEILFLRKEIFSKYKDAVKLLSNIIRLVSGEAVVHVGGNPKVIDAEKSQTLLKEEHQKIKKSLEKMESDIRRIREDMIKERRLNIVSHDEIFQRAVTFISGFNKNEMLKYLENANGNRGIIVELARKYGIPYEENIQEFIKILEEKENKYEEFLNKDIRLLEDIENRL
ncbi:hypothetical protein YN1_1540 [Nanoarchaeota archaeon]